MKRIILSLMFAALFVNSTCFAATLILKSGKEIQGEIVSKTDRVVRINIQGVILTYDSSDIEKIVEDSSAATAPAGALKPAAPVLQEKKVLPTVNPKPLTTVAPDKLEATTATGNQLSSSASKNDLALTLIEASGAKENMNQMFSQIISQANPQESEKLRAVFDVNEVVAQLAPVYDKYFTEEELKGLIDFYKGPLGRKLLLVTPQIMQDSMNISLVYFQQKLQSVQGR